MFDIAVIGGGINGCGIARDAAGRGLSVYLCEQGDLAGATSSASTKLIHGGLRYLEHGEIRLVREALAEREVLWAMAPHVVWPLRFVLPHHAGLRPAWLLRTGLFLYDHLGGRRRLPGTRSLDLRVDPAGQPLAPGASSRGFEYSDCWVDDARLVVLNARDAADHGAVIETRTRAVAAARGPDAWRIMVEGARGGAAGLRRARVLVNAAGPWVAAVAGVALGRAPGASVRLVQGSHIVVPRLYGHDRCYILQNSDRRVVFAIPFESDFTLIGTTDRDYVGDPASARTTAQEIDYLCAAANAWFARKIAPSDVVWSYSGVRPLYDDGTAAAQSATRDYVLQLDEARGAPLLSVFGGKITTYRRLAMHALDRLARHLPGMTDHAGWTGRSPLPGGDFPADGFEALARELHSHHAWLSAAHARRLSRAYGTRAPEVIGDARSMADMGRAFGAGLTAREVAYLMGEEWAQEADDVLWRRSKLGLRLGPEQVAALGEWMASARS